VHLLKREEREKKRKNEIGNAKFAKFGKFENSKRFIIRKNLRIRDIRSETLPIVLQEIKLESVANECNVARHCSLSVLPKIIRERFIEGRLRKRKNNGDEGSEGRARRGNKRKKK
jgi:hypothetical protein